MEKKSSSGTALLFLLFVLSIVLGWKFAEKYLGQEQATPIVSTPYAFAQNQPVYAPSTLDAHQATVDAFYSVPAESTPIPTIEAPTQPPALPSIKLTTCIDSPIFSTTNYGQEYIVGVAAKGLTFDIVERSSDSQWVKLAQSNETYEFWIPAVAFCFVP
jgi:hypothetical protein